MTYNSSLYESTLITIPSFLTATPLIVLFKQTFISLRIIVKTICYYISRQQVGNDLVLSLARAELCQVNLLRA